MEGCTSSCSETVGAAVRGEEAVKSTHPGSRSISPGNGVEWKECQAAQQEAWVTAWVLPLASS